MSHNLSVIIPVFNEINTVELLLEKVAAMPAVHQIIIVDDCSTDQTRELLVGLQGKYDFILVLNGKNSGKGASIKNGIKYITGDLVIIQDADLEYEPKDYDKLIAKLSAGEADAVFGSRFLNYGGNMAMASKFGNTFLTHCTNLLYGSNLTDMETCYKLMPASFLKQADLSAERFDFEPEITAKLLRSGLKIGEVPINYCGRSAINGKKITWLDGFSALKVLIKYRFYEK